MNEERLASLKDRLEKVYSKMIIVQVCKEHGVTEEDLFSLSRKREIVDARNVCQYHQYMDLQWSLAEITRYWGMKHSSTIRYAVEKVEDLGLRAKIEL